MSGSYLGRVTEFSTLWVGRIWVWSVIFLHKSRVLDISNWSTYTRMRFSTLSIDLHTQGWDSRHFHWSTYTRVKFSTLSIDLHTQGWDSWHWDELVRRTAKCLSDGYSCRTQPAEIDQSAMGKREVVPVTTEHCTLLCLCSGLWVFGLNSLRWVAILNSQVLLLPRPRSLGIPHPQARFHVQFMIHVQVRIHLQVRLHLQVGLHHRSGRLHLQVRQAPCKGQAGSIYRSGSITCQAPSTGQAPSKGKAPP